MKNIAKIETSTLDKTALLIKTGIDKKELDINI